MITFENLNIGSSSLHIWFISREYGSSSYMKVIGSRSRSQEQVKNPYSLFLQIKIPHRAMKFACSMGFSAMADWTAIFVT